MKAECGECKVLAVKEEKKTQSDSLKKVDVANL